MLNLALFASMPASAQDCGRLHDQIVDASTEETRAAAVKSAIADAKRRCSQPACSLLLHTMTSPGPVQLTEKTVAFTGSVISICADVNKKGRAGQTEATKLACPGSAGFQVPYGKNDLDAAAETTKQLAALTECGAGCEKSKEGPLPGFFGDGMAFAYVHCVPAPGRFKTLPLKGFRKQKSALVPFRSKTN